MSRKIKILSITLATLLLIQATSANCFFGRPKPISPEKELLKDMTKTSLIVSSILILTAIIPAIVLKLTNSDNLYFGIWRQPRNDGPQNPQNPGNPEQPRIIVLRDPTDNEHRIKFKAGINCFNKKITWPKDEKGHKLDNGNTQGPNVEWKELQKAKYKNAHTKKDGTKLEKNNAKPEKEIDTKKLNKSIK